MRNGKEKRNKKNCNKKLLLFVFEIDSQNKRYLFFFF
jgi:hypothetical protein